MKGGMTQETMETLCRRVQELEAQRDTLQAEVEKWRFRYDKAEYRCDTSREDAYDHFMASEALRARLAGIVAAGRVDMEV